MLGLAIMSLDLLGRTGAGGCCQSIIGAIMLIYIGAVVVGTPVSREPGVAGRLPRRRRPAARRCAGPSCWSRCSWGWARWPETIAAQDVVPLAARGV